MRAVFLMFIFLPAYVFAQVNQTDANNLRQGTWQKQQPNGRLLYQGNFKDDKPVGEWKRFHSGGQVKAIISYHENSDTAFAQLFDEWGKKVAEGHYMNEQKTGWWFYFAEGRKVAGEQFINGVKHGVAHKYFDSGEILETVDWHHGKQEGKYEVFFKTGVPFMQYKVRNNQRNGLFLTWFQNGKLELEANYKNGLRHGNWKYYNNKGEFLYELKYNEGKLLNPEVRDSIANRQLQNFEKEKGSIADPEQYIEDPSGYMRKINIRN